MKSDVKTVVRQYQAQIQNHRSVIADHERAIANLENELQQFLKDNLKAVMACLMESETRVEAEPEHKTMTIVSVRFNGQGKTYDYEFVKVLPNETVSVGDIVVVETKWHSTASVEVMAVSEVDREEAEYDYKPAFSSIDSLCEYNVREGDV